MAAEEAGQVRYRHLCEQVKAAVPAGVLLPGARLPSVRTLASQYGVSATTALKALRTLEGRGFFESSWISRV